MVRKKRGVYVTLPSGKARRLAWHRVGASRKLVKINALDGARWAGKKSLYFPNVPKSKKHIVEQEIATRQSRMR